MRLLATLLVLMCLSGVVRADWFGLKDSKTEAPVAPATPSSAASGTLMQSARIRWLDKQTSRLDDYVVKAGTPLKLNDMTVSLGKCLADYGDTVLQDVAWLTVSEDGRDSPWFEGWMFNTFPEVATLDHPRYNMQLIGCGDGPRHKPVATVPAAQMKETAAPPADTEAPDDAPAGDEEAPAGDAAPAGADPYYVPGVENPAKETPAPADAEPAALPERAVEQPAAAPQEQPAPAGDQDELHEMMDGQ
ncbi:MAG: DUF2155 domain-containing protein [Proteobacteria bacterium]|nr:DUF2155 domain-containing protein [Pseudomonadota bacterium]